MAERVWLITGTSSPTGFGRSLVHAILAPSPSPTPSAPSNPAAQPPADKVIATARTLSSLADLAAQYPADRLQCLEWDVAAPPAALATQADAALRVWGRVDVLVNNAGVGGAGVSEEAGEEGYMRMYTPNVFGVLNTTNAFLPHFRERGAGTVIIVGSRSGFRTQVPMAGPYGSSKAAVHAIGEALNTELAPLNIRVCTVVPGSFRTSFQAPARAAQHAVADAHQIAAYDPLRAGVARYTSALAGRERGDPVRGARAIVGLVRGEYGTEGREEEGGEGEGKGEGKGRRWPCWLFLGKDCLADVRAKCARLLETAEAWEDVASSVDFDEGE